MMHTISQVFAKQIADHRKQIDKHTEAAAQAGKDAALFPKDLLVTRVSTHTVYANFRVTIDPGLAVREPHEGILEAIRSVLAQWEWTSLVRYKGTFVAICPELAPPPKWWKPIDEDDHTEGGSLEHLAPFYIRGGSHSAPAFVFYARPRGGGPLCEVHVTLPRYHTYTYELEEQHTACSAAATAMRTEAKGYTAAYSGVRHPKDVELRWPRFDYEYGTEDLDDFLRRVLGGA